jgi:hypothetical protein
VYDVVTLTVYVLYSTAAVSVRYGVTHCLCSVLHCCRECTIWWHSLSIFCTPLLLWVYDMVTLTVYVLYSTAAVSVRYGDTHCLCSVLHCCRECTMWWHSLFMFCTPLLPWVYDMVTLTLYSVLHCCCECTIWWHSAYNCEFFIQQLIRCWLWRHCGFAKWWCLLHIFFITEQLWVHIMVAVNVCFLYVFTCSLIPHLWILLSILNSRII